jgi:hypothetical protein
MEAIEHLLPWYAAGTLDAANAERVEAALAREPALRLSLSLIREDQEETVALNESLGAPSAAALDRVLAVVQAEPLKASLWARLASLTEFGARRAPMRWAYAGAAAAALVIALQTATIVTLLPSGNGSQYGTASEPSKGQEGSAVLVTFAPDVRLDQVAAFLRARNASIVDGPSGAGTYRVRVAKETLSRDELAKVVAQFSSDPIVQLALPASAH